MPFVSLTQFPILVCGFTLAIATYFVLPTEPPIWILWIAGVALILLAVLVSVIGRWRSLAMLAGVMIIGFGWAQMRTHWVAAHYAAPSFAGVGQVNLRGVITWAEVQPRSSKWDMRLIADDGRPYMLRLYGRKHHLENAKPGCHVDFQARVEPLPGPIIIGAYDPRRDAWFSGRRGQGFLRKITALDCEQQAGFGHRLANWRLDLAARYRADMSAEAGPVAAALITGVRGAIEKPVREAFRHSGLAHMLAISGLHMALFAGSIYALLRLLAACVPRLSLYYDTRKPSAVVSLMTATAYLFISGSGVATQRAFIMMAIFFLAILLDRPAVTMRNVLWAMLLVLMWQPQAVMQVGFQMNFAAVLALVAVYEIWQERDGLYLRWDQMSVVQQMGRRLWRYMSALVLTSMIAGSVTGFLAIVQFYRVGTYGLPANLLAMPVFGTLIMPMAPLSLLLMPFGLHGPVLSTMQAGIEAVLAVALYLTSYQHAVWQPGASPPFVLPVAVIGFLAFVLVHHRLRWLGLVPLTIGLIFIGQAQKPALHMFGRDLIVLRTDDDRLVQLRRRGHVYELQRIEAYHGLAVETQSCRPACRFELRDKIIIAYHDRPVGLSKSCRETDVIVMPFYEARYPCAAQLFDKTHFAVRGQVQLAIKDGGLTAQYAPTQRLWQDASGTIDIKNGVKAEAVSNSN